ncbi:hypothetical protein SBA1_1180021 [Candidatus Sulfotelmatobacter kueseliae]|uniref:Uncharacterized protein n=1 Tax=Candidatus Sulfotelmatobacter kueseliae TaxID=2042962 RepID=A0A2U3K1B7_9BACT|nr:hypothetical protein SBA1_1180021 [Candidatus Sulfotelmatobacter kueseliae]
MQSAQILTQEARLLARMLMVTAIFTTHS